MISGIFPICSGTVRGFSRFVLFLFLGLLRAPTRNSPERVRDTIWTFPEKSGKHPGLETPRFSFPQKSLCQDLSSRERNRVTLRRLWSLLAKCQSTAKCQCRNGSLWLPSEVSRMRAARRVCNVMLRNIHAVKIFQKSP